MASPSAPVWVVTAAFVRPFKKSATSRVVLFLVRVCIFSRLSNIFECCLDPIDVLHDWVRLEPEPRRALETCLCSHGGLDATGCALQALAGSFQVLIGEDAV